jgi:FtsX-like permease family
MGGDVNRRVARVAWYWFRTSLSRRWTGYLAIVLLIGLVGGVAIGSVGAARRTNSSFTVFLASTNPSQISLLINAPNVTSVLLRLPHVRHIETSIEADMGFPAGQHGAPRIPSALLSGDVAEMGSLNGEYFSEDKATVVSGQMADPRKRTQFVMTSAAERLMGWRVGQVVPMFFYTSAEENLASFGTDKVKPILRLNMRLVGTVVLNDEVVLDEVDRYPAPMIFTPALTDELRGTGVNYDNYNLQLYGGSRNVPEVERDIVAQLPKGATYNFHVTSTVTGQVNRSIKPDAIALGFFGLIAALAAIIIAGSMIARTLQSDDDDLELLRSLGATPLMTVSASLIGIFGAIAAGALLADVVAIALSPLSPIGPVRAVYPHQGVSADWAVLGVGFAFLTLVLASLSVVLAVRMSRRSRTQPRVLTPAVGATMARLLGEAGLPVTSVVGVRFAIDPGKHRESVPVRAALLGAVLAVTIVVATLTFGSSLNTLISRPALYGWNWNYALLNPPPQSTNLLKSDPYVAAWSGYGSPDIQIDGTTVPALIGSVDAKVSPPLLSGHEVEGVDQIVLGAATMQQLHEHVGGTVLGSYGSPKDAPIYVPTTRLTIVGTATLPAVGTALTLHPSMGTGAIISGRLEPPAMQRATKNPVRALDGPALVFVRLRNGVSNSRALASLDRIAAVGDRVFAAVPDGQAAGDSVIVEPVQYPAEIENYRSIGATPVVLALALTAGAVVALGLTLAASVRRRRRNLALLRVLGFTGRQLKVTIAWQASVAGLVGIVIGIPAGIALGRWFWTLFARYIDAVPEPTVPVVSVVIVAVSALVLANVVAMLPGRSAAKTSTAQVLRGE